jgi:hypothetical protein
MENSQPRPKDEGEATAGRRLTADDRSGVKSCRNSRVACRVREEEEEEEEDGLSVALGGS